MLSRIAVVLVAAALSIVLAGSASAHEGHDHAAAFSPAAPLATPRGEAASDALELVAVAAGDGLTVYLDRFGTNEPIGDAMVTVESPSGPANLTARPDGIYRLQAPWLAKPGRHDLLFTLSVNGAANILPVTLTVPEVAGRKGTLAGETGPGLGQRLVRQDPVLIGVAVLAFLLGIVVTLLFRRGRTVTALAVTAVAAVLMVGTTAFAHEGEEHNEAAPGGMSAVPAVRGDLAQRLPDGGVFVPKSTQRILAIRTQVTEAAKYRRSIELPARIIPDPNASGVVQSSVGGRLSAPEGGFPRLGTPVKKGAILAYVTPPVQRVDVSDMRQRQGELDQQIATVSRRVARYERLAPSGAIARVQLDEAEDELRGLRDRRAALDKIRAETEALLAPVDGIIAESTAVAGQMAASGAVVFQVVDPTRLWVEALSFEPLAGANAATARLADGRTLPLTYRGSGFADRNQSVAVQFAVQGDTAGLRIGQFVTVQAETNDESQGLAIPRASVVRGSNGQDVVYEHMTAEQFTVRPVRVAPLDGERVLVAAGLLPGRRIVTQGAELLDQVR